jgi:hypothetical protein
MTDLEKDAIRYTLKIWGDACCEMNIFPIVLLGMPEGKPDQGCIWQPANGLPADKLKIFLSLVVRSIPDHQGFLQTRPHSVDLK